MNHRKFIIWSNLFFVFPLVFSLYLENWVSFTLILAVMIVSSLYHLAKEKRFFYLDSSFAWLLIVSNLWISYLGSFKLPYFLFALAFVFCALYFYFTQNENNKNYNHGMWHLFSSLITLFSILTFWAGK